MNVTDDVSRSKFRERAAGYMHASLADTAGFYKTNEGEYEFHIYCFSFSTDLVQVKTRLTSCLLIS